MSLLTIAALTVQPPERFPDLHSVLISVYSCAHFVVFLIYFHCKQFTLTDTKQNTRGRTKKLEDSGDDRNMKLDTQSHIDAIGRKKVKSH